MSNIKRQSIKSTIYTYSGVALGFVTTALLFPKYLTPTQIGVLSLLVSYGLILGQFGTLGLGGTITKFLPSFRDKSTGHGGFLTLILIISLIGFLLSLAVFVIFRPYLESNNLGDSALFVQYMDLIVPLTFFGILFSVLDVYYSALFVPTTGTILRDVIHRFLFIFFFLFLIFQIIDFHIYVYLYTFSIGLITILFVLFLAYRKEFVLTFNLQKFNRPMLATIGSYAMFSWLNGFSSLAVMRIDIIMLNAYYDTAVAGIYATTFYFATLILLPSRVFSKTSAIYFSEAFHRNDTKAIERMHLKVSLNQWIIGLYVMLGLVCNLHNIFKILPQEYEAGKWVIVVIGFSNLIRMLGGMDNAIIDYSKNYRILTFFLIIFLVFQVLFNFLLIPLYQMAGAAIASLLAVSIFTGIKATYIYFKMKIVSFSFAHFVSLLLAVVVYITIWRIPQLEHYVLDIGIRAVAITLLFGGLILFLNLSEDINQIFRKAISKLGI